MALFRNFLADDLGHLVDELQNQSGLVLVCRASCRRSCIFSARAPRRSCTFAHGARGIVGMMAT